MLRKYQEDAVFQTNFDSVLFPRPNIGLNSASSKQETHFEKQNTSSFNQAAPQAVAVKKAVKKTLPPLNPTYKQRLKYEVSHYVLESIKLICSDQNSLTPALADEKKEASGYIEFYESRVKRPGSARILQGLTLIRLLCRPFPPNNEIKQLYSEADEKDTHTHNQPQRRNLERAKRILLQMKGLNASNDR